MRSELIVNLWAIYDASVGAIYCLSGKVYAVSGSDSEKLQLLKSLARTDYLTVKRYPVSDRFAICGPGGQERRGVTYLNALEDGGYTLFAEVFSALELEIPATPDFSGDEPRWIKQKLPDNPLCVVTVLYEDAYGNIRAIIDDDDRRWIQEQELQGIY